MATQNAHPRRPVEDDTGVPTKVKPPRRTMRPVYCGVGRVLAHRVVTDQSVVRAGVREDG